MEQVECVVVGAGVVGLATARRLAAAGREVVILEAADAFGSGVSSRNSEVVHAGIYYEAGSLKARTCVAGREALYAFCRERGVEHKRLGKLIVATDDGQRARLAAIKAHAEANGVGDMRELTEAEARALEPELACVAALLSPSTGIIDAHGLMLALLGDAEAHGAALALLSPLLSGRAVGDGIELSVGGADPMPLRCRVLINAAGLDAQAVAASIDGVPPAVIPPRRLAKGNYYALASGRAPFARLVYPVPEDGGLGVHLTLDLGGQARFGPDVEWTDRVDYTVDPARAEVFYAAIRRYWPALSDGTLVPAYAGVRPKLSGPGEPARDFEIQGPDVHKVAGLINLFGIESPGLTASLALADLIAERLEIR